MHLKKLLCLWWCFFVVLFSCQKAKKIIIKDKWADYRKAYSLLLKKQVDSAFYYFNKVVSNAGDSSQIDMAYTNMSIIQSDAGDFYGAMESAAKSLNFLDDNNAKYRSCITSDYNELGLNSDNLKNYNDALAYYNKSMKFIDDPEARLINLNNKAYIYQEKNDNVQALKILNNILSQAQPNSATYAMILTNIAASRSLVDSRYNAMSDLLKGLKIRIKKNDLRGQSSSYAHLADYYYDKRPDAALFYAKENYAVCLRINSPDYRLHALQRLIEYGLPKDVKQYFANYQTLSDSLQTARNAAKNQFAVIRYDVEKSKADNLKLQKDNSEAQYQLIKEQVLLWSAIILFAAGTVFAVLWYQKRKQRIDEDTQNAIQQNQLKISKKVHDVVANGLYRMMAEIENQDNINKDKLLDSIEDMYEKSRDISYDNVQHFTQFHEKISQLLTSFATNNIRVLLAGNSAELWEKAGPHAGYEVEHILQELMVNMKKHSKASNVAIKFERENSRVNIYYTDNGIGMPEKIIFKNGLNNTGNRINLLNGIITFDTHHERGLKIFISFPIT